MSIKRWPVTQTMNPHNGILCSHSDRADLHPERADVKPTPRSSFCYCCFNIHRQLLNESHLQTVRWSWPAALYVIFCSSVLQRMDSEIKSFLLLIFLLLIFLCCNVIHKCMHIWTLSKRRDILWRKKLDNKFFKKTMEIKNLNLGEGGRQHILFTELRHSRQLSSKSGMEKTRHLAAEESPGSWLYSFWCLWNWAWASSAFSRRGQRRSVPFGF